jgi:DNA-binding response OmpR family regulator
MHELQPTLRLAKGIEMQLTPRILIVDDDTDASEFLEYRLRKAIPQAHIETRDTPEVSGGFDIYLLDNDFGGEMFAGVLAQSIRRIQRDALVIAFSAHLDATTLKQLINAGCDGACEKHEPEEVDQLMNVIRSFVSSWTNNRRHPSSRKGLVATILSITELLREWNRRLDNQTQQLETISQKK